MDKPKGFGYMSKPIRIAFVGKAGAGKTTQANRLIRRCRPLSLAKPVKEVAAIKQAMPLRNWYDALRCIAFDILRVTFIDQRAEELSHELAAMWLLDFIQSKDRRELLQRIGTDSGRKIADDIWINIVDEQLEKAPELPYVVDDVRFQIGRAHV